MTPDEAFKKFLTAHEHNDLPWEMQEEEMRPTFMAGWHAHAESLKQTELAALGGGEPERVVQRLGDGLGPMATGHYGLLAGMEHAPEHMHVELRKIAAEEIYAAYPRKIGKQAALKAINKVPSKIRDGGFAVRAYLLERTKAYAAAVARWPAHERKFIPHPATWFNRGSYDDDPKEWQRAGGAGSQFNSVSS